MLSTISGSKAWANLPASDWIIKGKELGYPRIEVRCKLFVDSNFGQSAALIPCSDTASRVCDHSTHAVGVGSLHNCSSEMSSCMRPENAELRL